MLCMSTCKPSHPMTDCEGRFSAQSQNYCLQIFSLYMHAWSVTVFHNKIWSEWCDAHSGSLHDQGFIQRGDTRIRIYVQNFIKVYKTLAGALTYTCIICTHVRLPPPRKNSCMKPWRWSSIFLVFTYEVVIVTTFNTWITTWAPVLHMCLQSFLSLYMCNLLWTIATLLGMILGMKQGDVSHQDCAWGEPEHATHCWFHIFATSYMYRYG